MLLFVALLALLLDSSNCHERRRDGKDYSDSAPSQTGSSRSSRSARSARSAQTGSTTCKQVGSKGLILLPGHDEAEIKTICKDKTMRLDNYNKCCM